MSKKELLKNNLNKERTGGIDALIQSTTTRAAKPAKAVIDNEKDVHCNFVMNRNYHKILKGIANNRGVPFKVLLAEVCQEYIENHKDEI